MLARVGDPQQLAGPDGFATWRVALSEDPNLGWRRQFLTYAYGSGLFAGDQMTVVPGALDIGPMTRDILEPAGYVVLPTSDPVEAVRLARQRRGAIDLLLVDVVMPVMDGRELAGRILELRPNMKVILMSGYEVSGLGETGWPFIEKPFGIEALGQKVADTLREGRGPS